VILKHSPEDSAYAVATGGESAVWSTTDHLLAVVANALMIANWQRSGGKQSDMPELIERPGSTPKNNHYGTAMPLHELIEFLARPRTEAN